MGCEWGEYMAPDHGAALTETVLAVGPHKIPLLALRQVPESDSYETGLGQRRAVVLCHILPPLTSHT